MTVRTCLRCGTALRTPNTRAKFCSSSCRARAAEDRAAGIPDPVRMPRRREPTTPIAPILERWLAQIGPHDAHVADAARVVARRLDDDLAGAHGLVPLVDALRLLMRGLDPESPENRRRVIPYQQPDE
jgi:hypothetical protein